MSNYPAQMTTPAICKRGDWCVGLCLALLMAAFSTVGHAAEYLVRDQDAYRAAVAKLAPGDVVVLANGVWQDFEIVFAGEGTEARPITLTAEEKGKVILSGQSNL